MHNHNDICSLCSARLRIWMLNATAFHVRCGYQVAAGCCCCCCFQWKCKIPAIGITNGATTSGRARTHTHSRHVQWNPIPWSVPRSQKSHRNRFSLSSNVSRSLAQVTYKYPIEPINRHSLRITFFQTKHLTARATINFHSRSVCISKIVCRNCYIDKLNMKVLVSAINCYHTLQTASHHTKTTTLCAQKENGQWRLSK